MDQHQNDRSSAGPTRPSLSANAPAFYPSSTNNRDMMPPPPRYAAMPPPQQYHRQSNYHHGPPTAFPQRQSRWGPSPRFAPPPVPPPRPVPPQQIQSHQKTQVASYNVEMVKVEVKREQSEKRVSDSSAGAESAKASRNDQSTSLKRSTPESVNVRSCDQTNLFTIDRQGHNVDGCDAPAKRVKKEFASRHRNASTSTACAHLNCISNVPVKSESSGKDEALNNVVDLAMDSPAKNTQSNDLKDEEVHELDVSSSGTDAVSDTHVIFAIDCSSSMKKVDVYSSRGKISRWTAVFKCVDTFIEQQRQHHNSGAEEKCFISLLIFNNSAKVLMNRIRLDDCARVQAALKKAEREKPIGGTSFSAGFQEVYALSNGSGDKDKVMVVFLSDGRPGDLRSTPPKDSSADMQPTFKCHGKKYPSASHWIEKMMDKSNKQVNFQFICLYDEGKHWMEYLSSRHKGTFHNPDLSLDDDNLSTDEGIEVIPMKVKSSRTLIREKYEHAKNAGQIISVGATTTRSSSIQSTFSSISATFTGMRSEKPRERDVIIRAESAMITYEATRMILTSDADGNKSFVVAPGETANERKIQVSMHPFAQGGLRNVYRMQQSSGELTLIAVAKESRHDIKYQERLKFHLETAICQLRASKYAKSFKQSLKNTKISQEIPPIKVLRTEVYRLKAPTHPGGYRYLAVENELAGQYAKYNNNDGYVNESECIECRVAQAFSHFSFEKSRRQEIVVDIQGSGCTYTDPQLHSVDEAYGRADRGEHGFARFFKTHKCNFLCKELGLPEHQGKVFV